MLLTRQRTRVYNVAPGSLNQGNSCRCSIRHTDRGVLLAGSINFAGRLHVTASRPGPLEVSRGLVLKKSDSEICQCRHHLALIQYAAYRSYSPGDSQSNNSTAFRVCSVPYVCSQWRCLLVRRWKPHLTFSWPPRTEFLGRHCNRGSQQATCRRRLTH